MFSDMNSVQERLRHYREEILGLSLREFRHRFNEHVGDADAVSLGTLSNYERPAPPGSRRPGPRAEFLAAVGEMFPDLRIDWLLFGDGQPSRIAERLAAPEGLEGRTRPHGGLAARILTRYPDLELLSPEASALFMATVTRLAMGEPDGSLDEDHLLELAGDVRWLLFLPVSLWGFGHAPDYQTFTDYCVAQLHALTQLLPPAGGGDAIGEYGDSLAPALRSAHTVGF